MVERHLMVTTDSSGTGSLFECTVEGCGRRLVLDHAEVRLVVLEAGEPGALHHGSTGLVGLDASVGRNLPRAS